MNHPFSRNRRAVSRPIPEAAPVIKIDLRPLAVPIEFSPMRLLGIEHSRSSRRLANGRAETSPPAPLASPSGERSDKTGCFVYVLGSCGIDGCRTYVGWLNHLRRR